MAKHLISVRDLKKEDIQELKNLCEDFKRGRYTWME